MSAEHYEPEQIAYLLQRRREPRHRAAYERMVRCALRTVHLAGCCLHFSDFLEGADLYDDGQAARGKPGFDWREFQEVPQ